MLKCVPVSALVKYFLSRNKPNLYTSYIMDNISVIFENYNYTFRVMGNAPWRC